MERCKRYGGIFGLTAALLVMAAAILILWSMVKDMNRKPDGRSAVLVRAETEAHLHG